MSESYGLSDQRYRHYALLWKVLLCLLLMGHALGCMSWATQQIALLVQYHPTLSGRVFGNWYWPWQCLIWQQAYPGIPSIDAVIDKAMMVFGFPMGVVLLLAMAAQHRPKGRSDVHGTARWATVEDMRNAGLLEGSGVYVGGWKPGSMRQVRYLTHNGPEHIMAFAPTRSGKGVGLVLPTLLSWPESSIVLDIKGENWALTAGWRKSQGHRVIKFDPIDTDTSARFNPLAEIRIYEESAIRDAQNMTTMILDPDGKGMKDFWDKSAFSFFVGALLHCVVMALQAGQVASLRDLSLMLADPNLDIQDLFQQMIDTDHAAILTAKSRPVRFAQELHETIAASAQEMRNKADRELSGVLSSAAVNLSLYRDPTIAYVTGASDFSVDDLMHHDAPVSLYMVIRPSEIDRLRPVVRLILNLFLRRLTEHMDFEDGRSVAGYKHRLLLMLDEFTSLGKLEIVERSLAFMAGYGLKAYFIVQDLTQLQGAYGKEESIMSNCHIRIAYAPNKRETAEVLSAMTGKTTVVQRKTSVSGDRSSAHLKNASVSISEVARPLLTPDECMRLPGARKDKKGNVTRAGDMLIFPAGFRAIYGRQILYFQDSVFSQRARIPAPEHSDRIETTPAPPVFPVVEPALVSAPETGEELARRERMARFDAAYEALRAPRSEEGGHA